MGKPATQQQDDPAEIVRDYLVKQNRPFSAADITANLASRVKLGKVVLTKILKELQEKELIEARVAGKSVVYHVKQNITPECSPEALNALDEEVDNFRTRISTLRTTEKSLRSRLAGLQQAAMFTPAVLRATIVAKQLEVEELKRQMEELRASTDGGAAADGVNGAVPAGEDGKKNGQGRRKGNGAHSQGHDDDNKDYNDENVAGEDSEEESAASPATTARLDAEIQKWRLIGKRRRAIAREIWGMIEDGVKNSGGNVNDLRDMFDIDD